ncbi:MAG: LicD family protein [Chlamydiia bacterium]|nr:LicD family protein [Chlamydiia bacterium]
MMKQLYSFIFAILTLFSSISAEKFINTDHRLLVVIETESCFSAKEFANATGALLVNGDKRNPYLAFQPIYLDSPFVVCEHAFTVRKIHHLARRFGYRFLSINSSTLEEAIEMVNEARCNSPTSTKDLPCMSEIELAQFYLLFEKIDQIFTENQIPYWGARTSLLGAVQMKGLIPWNDDYAICAYQSDEEAILQLESQLNDAGLGLYHDSKKEFYKIYDKSGAIVSESVPFCYPSIDLFLFSLEKKNECEDVYVHHSQDFYQYYPHERFFFSELETLKRQPFGPLALPVPSEHKRYLNAYYGRDEYPNLWEKYAKESHWNHKNETRSSSGTAFIEIIP